MTPPVVTISNEERIKRWIDHKLVDREALSRNYAMKPDVKDKMQRYTNQLLRRTFIQNAIIPKIEISQEELKEYYLQHQEDFLKPVLFRILQITVKTEDEAQSVLSSLQKDADFSWLARNKSTDTAALKGGSIGWRTKGSFSEPEQEAIDTLEPGEISPILKVESQFRIIKLQEKSEKEFEKFDTVKSAVHKTVFIRKINEMYNEFVNALKKEAQIEVNEAAIHLFEESFKN
jgi:peptidyl-prolyl cis-trans isomerase C